MARRMGRCRRDSGIVRSWKGAYWSLHRAKQSGQYVWGGRIACARAALDLLFVLDYADRSRVHTGVGKTLWRADHAIKECHMDRAATALGSARTGNRRQSRIDAIARTYSPALGVRPPRFQ